MLSMPLAVLSIEKNTAIADGKDKHALPLITHMSAINQSLQLFAGAFWLQDYRLSPSKNISNIWHEPTTAVGHVRKHTDNA